MSIARRLREVRGTLSRRAFARRMRVHMNTVANYENGRDPPASYIARVAESTGVALPWLLRGVGERIPSGRTLDARLAYAVARAIHQVYGDDLRLLPLAERARLLEATHTYLQTIGVTEEVVPALQSLEGLVRLTAGLLGVGATPEQ